MKEAFKKVFDKSVLLVVGVVLGCGIIFQYIVFPGLTTNNTYLNLISLIIGIFTIYFIFRTIQWNDLFEFLFGKNDTILPGETELDYVPKEEVVKKKRVYKKKKKPLKKTTILTEEEERKIIENIKNKGLYQEPIKKK